MAGAVDERRSNADLSPGLARLLRDGACRARATDAAICTWDVGKAAAAGEQPGCKAEADDTGRQGRAPLLSRLLRGALLPCSWGGSAPALTLCHVPYDLVLLPLTASCRASAVRSLGEEEGAVGVRSRCNSLGKLDCAQRYHALLVSPATAVDGCHHWRQLIKGSDSDVGGSLDY